MGKTNLLCGKWFNTELRVNTYFQRLFLSYYRGAPSQASAAYHPYSSIVQCWSHKYKNKCLKFIISFDWSNLDSVQIMRVIWFNFIEAIISLSACGFDTPPQERESKNFSVILIHAVSSSFKRITLKVKAPAVKTGFIWNIRGVSTVHSSYTIISWNSLFLMIIFIETRTVRAADSSLVSSLRQRRARRPVLRWYAEVAVWTKTWIFPI